MPVQDDIGIEALSLNQKFTPICSRSHHVVFGLQELHESFNQ
ncbi:MAG: hypothetical protein V3R93_06655 [Candidatus Hydrothermarchaeaceae archaeon]